MKKTLLTVIITLAVVVGVLLVTHYVWGDGECIFGDDDKTECTKAEKKECCDKKHEKKKCGDKEHSHAMMMEHLAPIRAEFDTQLNDEEKAVITGVREKFADVDHAKLCEEGKGKFMEEHKADFDALTVIADNHEEYFDGLFAKMHEEKEGCKHDEDGEVHGDGEGEGHDNDDDGEVKKPHECPEAEKCKDATEKCKGEKTAEAEKKCDEEEVKKCKEAEEKCAQECANTFKIHFLLLEAK